MSKIIQTVAFATILCSGCATYPNTYIQDSTITTNTQGGVVGTPNVGYSASPGNFLQWLIFGPPGGYYGGGWGGGYYPPVGYYGGGWGGGGFWYNGNGGRWGGGCW